MTSQTKHTPTPWTLHNRVIYGRGGTSEVFGLTEFATGEPHDANAAFIVLACNHHDELVSALRLTTDTLANCREAMLDLGVRGKVEEQIGLLVATSRAILAKLTP